jgi:hypothetical protein
MSHRPGLTLSSSLLLAVVAFAVAGCAQRPFLRADGPARSQGVAVALVSQDCVTDYDPDTATMDLLDLRLRVQVRNDAPAPVTCHPEAIRLLAAGEIFGPDEADQPAVIGPGASRMVGVHFVQRTGSVCNEPMSLSLDHVVALQNRDLPLAPRSFVATDSDL